MMTTAQMLETSQTAAMQKRLFHNVLITDRSEKAGEDSSAGTPAAGISLTGCTGSHQLHCLSARPTNGIRKPFHGTAQLDGPNHDRFRQRQNVEAVAPIGPAYTSWPRSRQSPQRRPERRVESTPGTLPRGTAMVGPGHRSG